MSMNARRSGLLSALGALGLFTIACSGTGSVSPSTGAQNGAAESTTATQPSASATSDGVDEELRSASFSTRGWQTDFSQRNVRFADILSGGPPRDGIPSIDDPQFISIEEGNTWLADREPVQVVEINGDARAYPTQILMWHEIVNDTVGGEPVAVTYCPLCNTAITFRRVLPEVGTVELGVSGNLYNSAMVMYDRSTESWYWQVSGLGIVGTMTDHQLEMVPSVLTSWAEFKQAHPDGIVLSRQTGFSRSYGQNPYRGYDTGNPFLFQGDHDDRLVAMERVVAVEIGEVAAAFPFSSLVDHPVVHEVVGGESIVVFYRPGAASPLDAGAIVEGRDVGSTAVYRPVARGEVLTFEASGDGFRDRETGSNWNLLGEATGGPLAGERLEPVVHGNHFWFSWAVYQPDTLIVRGE